MNSFPTLATSEFLAYIADNSSLGIHRAGYNGVASLIPRKTGNNIFVPTYAGLNYETIGLAGLTRYRHQNGSTCEPRSEPLRIEKVDERRVVLVQPETSHAHVNGRIIFSVEEPHYLHQRIELTFHRRFCATGAKNTFGSLWASYIHMPPDRHNYLRLEESASDLEGWVGVTKEEHAAQKFLIRPLPDNRELEAAEHLALMAELKPLPSQAKPPGGGPTGTRLEHGEIPLSFYYGFCHDELLFLMIFKQPEQFRFVYSPCGGGKEPAWNPALKLSEAHTSGPAWYYFLCIDDAELERTYCWDLCLVVKEYQSRADILNEVRRYQNAR